MLIPVEPLAPGPVPEGRAGRRADPARAERAVAELLDALGVDAGRPGLARTPARVAEAFAEMLAGEGEDPRERLGALIPAERADAPSGPVLVTGIRFRSLCEHHLLPFAGTAHIAYLPGESLVGLSGFSRLVETLAGRLQLQERLTEEVADAIADAVGPRGVAVVLEASHGCIAHRGARQADARCVTVAARGELTSPTARAEVLALLPLR